MLKKILICFIACMLFLTGACSDETDINASAIIFTRSECARCHEAISYLENTLQEKNPTLTFIIKDLSIGENRKLLQQFARDYHIEGGSIATPIIFTPKGYTTDWNKETPKKLKKMLNIR